VTLEAVRGTPSGDERRFSADFFDGRHSVMLGDSWATDDALVRPSFRNWFRPHHPYVFSNFGCARPR
jgi:iron(II)-dependent oxidoreductase